MSKKEAGTTVDIDTLPTVKQNICFADNLDIATGSLANNFGDVEGFDAAEKLMLFGVDDWKNHKGFQKAFAANRFENIELFGCEMKEEAAKSLAAGLKTEGGKKIGTLELDNSPLDAAGAKAIIEALNESDKIRTLNLQGSVKTAEALKAMAKALEGNTYITKLDLKINEVKPEGAEALTKMLGGNRYLQELDLFYNEVGPIGCQHIGAALRNDQCALKVLNLCCNKIGDEGAVQLGDGLAVNRTLEELHLALNDIKDDGAKRLCDALNPCDKPTEEEVNKVFKVLDISANVIGKDGAKAIASLITYNKTMEMIDFTGIEPTPDGWEYFISAFRAFNLSDRKLNVKFSIVDIDDESLEEVERAIEGHQLIDYKRRDDAEETTEAAATPAAETTTTAN